MIALAVLLIIGIIGGIWVIWGLSVLSRHM